MSANVKSGSQYLQASPKMSRKIAPPSTRNPGNLPAELARYVIFGKTSFAKANFAKANFA